MENPNGSYQSETENKKRKLSTGSKIAILVVLIVLLAVGILLPIKLVPNAVSSFATSISSFFVGNKEVKITTDRTEINTGEAFTISWSGKHQTNGTYALSYECATGVRLETSINQPNETIACGSTYYFIPNENKLELTAFSDANRYSDIHITLGFLENGASTVDTLGTTTVTITNPNLSETDTTGAATSTPTVVREPAEEDTEPTVKPTTPTRPSRPVSNPNGTADLEVRPVAVGYLSQNGNFVPSGTIGAHQQAAVKFQIVNVGDKNSGEWGFSVDIPSETDPRYVSSTQQNLGPGDRIEYVLGFKNIKNVQENMVTVYADPSNFVREVSEANNIARMRLVNGIGYGQPDLIVRVLDTGVINKSTGAYTAGTSVSSSDKAGVRFEVENIGSSNANNWKFRATLPTLDSNNVTFTSDTQPTLAPGQKFVFTVGFENVRFQGNNSISLQVDSDNTVTESNENNNYASGNIYRN